MDQIEIKGDDEDFKILIAQDNELVGIYRIFSHDYKLYFSKMNSYTPNNHIPRKLLNIAIAEFQDIANRRKQEVTHSVALFNLRSVHKLSGLFEEHEYELEIKEDSPEFTHWRRVFPPNN